jgi:hypothetical protein
MATRSKKTPARPSRAWQKTEVWLERFQEAGVDAERGQMIVTALTQQTHILAMDILRDRDEGHEIQLSPEEFVFAREAEELINRARVQVIENPGPVGPRLKR